MDVRQVASTRFWGSMLLAYLLFLLLRSLLGTPVAAATLALLWLVSSVARSVTAQTHD